MTSQNESATSQANGDARIHVAVGVLRGELDLGVVYLSDAAAAMLGMPSDRALGHGWLEALDPRDRGLAADALIAAATSGGSRDVDCRVIAGGATRTIPLV